MRRSVRSVLVCVALSLTACGGPARSPEPGAGTAAPTTSAPSPVPMTATVAPATATAVPTTPTPAPSATPATLFAPVSADDWQLGPAEARVTIVDYSDFQCPFCAQLAPALVQLQSEFPEDVRIVYRHFPLINIHDKAVLAAEASEAAGAQDSFWAMHDLLYARQSQWSGLTPEQFRSALGEYAAQIGLDVERFSREMEQGLYTPVVMADYQTAADIPLPGTPFLLFNGEIYQGPVEHWALAALVRLERFKERQFAEPPPEVINPFARYTATLRTVRGDVVIELFAEQAPLTVNNFVFLARQGWFDGMTFHRVQPGFVVQTGDPSGTGYGNPGYYLPNEVHPDLTFEGGSWVGMANAGPDSNGSQFFITLPPATQAEVEAIRDLTGKYTLFGRVVQGMDVLSRLTPRDPQANPEAVPGDVVLSVTVEED